MHKVPFKFEVAFGQQPEVEPEKKKKKSPLFNRKTRFKISSKKVYERLPFLNTTNKTRRILYRKHHPAYNPPLTDG